MSSIKNKIEKFNRIYASGQISICQEMQCTPDKQYAQNIIAHAKLEMGQSGDACEREADRVADAVMRMPEPGVQKQPEEEEEELLQAKPLVEQITPIGSKTG